jgi:hypothetical protein
MCSIQVGHVDDPTRMVQYIAMLYTCQYHLAEAQNTFSGNCVMSSTKWTGQNQRMSRDR